MLINFSSTTEFAKLFTNINDDISFRTFRKNKTEKKYLPNLTKIKTQKIKSKRQYIFFIINTDFHDIHINNWPKVKYIELNLLHSDVC